MFFQVVHTHTRETCPGRSLEEVKRIDEWWQSLKKTPGLKVLAGYITPIEHAYYITVEADDYSTVSRAFGALNNYGTGRIIPVLTFDQTIPIAQTGAFGASK